MNKTILLVGTGAMAREYAKVLVDLKCDVSAVGNSEESSKKFEDETKIPTTNGGISKWLKENNEFPQKAIVVVPENLLGKVTIELIRAGVRSILVEKPGGKDIAEIKKVAQAAKKYRAEIVVGYNRRQYASVKKAQEIIKQDGGVTSFNFEFTEWAHVIEPLKKAPGVKENWFLHNSTHVVDLAFYLGGDPKKISAFTAGKLSWHPKASIFSGAGVTKRGAIFSYQANWTSPGRWGVEILTKKHRLILRPLEKLQVQNIGSVAITEEKIDDEMDQKFKAGLFDQVKFFLEDNRKELCLIEEQVSNLPIYYKILSSRTN
jgi:predicted dehydrogenase